MSARDDLRAVFFDTVTSAMVLDWPDVTIQYENHKFVQPAADPWVGLSLRFIDSMPTTISHSNRFVRHIGFLQADVYVPEDSGTKDMWDIAYTIENSLAEQDINLNGGGRVVIQMPRVTPATRQNAFHFVTVLAPFRLDACYPT